MQNRDHQKLITHISLSLSNKGVDDDRFEETKEGKNRGGSFRDNHLEEQVSSSEHSVTETEDIFDKNQGHRELADSGDESSDSIEFIENKKIDRGSFSIPNLTNKEEESKE